LTEQEVADIGSALVRAKIERFMQQLAPTAAGQPALAA